MGQSWADHGQAMGQPCMQLCMQPDTVTCQVQTARSNLISPWPGMDSVARQPGLNKCNHGQHGLAVAEAQTAITSQASTCTNSHIGLISHGQPMSTHVGQIGYTQPYLKSVSIAGHGWTLMDQAVPDCSLLDTWLPHGWSLLATALPWLTLGVPGWIV